MLDTPAPQTAPKRSVLPPGYEINGYVIKSILGRGGFGITYLAHDTNLDRPVAVKEYLPGDFSSRDNNYTVHPKTGEQSEIYAWGLDRFLAEARTLARFEHPNIVHVNTVFEKNNTAYMIMRFEHGGDLASVFDKGQQRDQESLLNIVLPILDGLKLVHGSGFIHRDIKPSNIYIRQDNSPVLLDFGSARQSISGQTSNLTRLVSHAYTPFEQYNDQQGAQGPWTDIYSMGATLYYGVLGQLPVDSMFRGSSIIDDGTDSQPKLAKLDLPGFSKEFLAAIDWALEFRQKDRPQTCEDWIDALLGRTRDISLIVPVEDKKQVDDDPDDDSTLIHERTRFAPVRPDSGLEIGEEDDSLLSNQTPIRPDSKIEVDPISSVQASSRIPDEVSHRVDGGTSLLMSDEDNFEPQRTQLATPSYKPEDIEKAAPRIRSKKKSKVPLFLSMSLLVVGAIAGGGYLYYEKMIRPAQDNLIAFSQMLTAAKKDLDEGRHILPEGSNAFEKYITALKSDSGNAAALSGLQNVISSVDKNLTDLRQQDKLPEAQTLIERLKTLSAETESFPQIATLQQTVIRQSELELDLDRSIQKAKASMDKGSILSPTGDNAIYWYRVVLSKQPNHTEALSGFNRAVDLALKDIESSISSGNISQANNGLSRLNNFNPPKERVDILTAKIKQIEADRAAQRKRDAEEARRKQEAQLAEVNKYKEAQKGKTSLQIINAKLSQFVDSLQKLDIDGLNEISNMSESTKTKLTEINEKFDSGVVTVSRLGIQRNQGLARAEVTIENLFDSSGEAFPPQNDWQKFTLSIRQQSGVWTGIEW